MIARVRRRMAMYPRIYADAAVDRIHTMRDFDQHIVARYGGFADADDYYYTVASSKYAGVLRVPTLIVHSLDDPFIRMLPATREALIGNPHVTLLETQHGGHCAFLCRASEAERRWPLGGADAAGISDVRRSGTRDGQGSSAWKLTGPRRSGRVSTGSMWTGPGFVDLRRRPEDDWLDRGGGRAARSCAKCCCC